MKKRLTAFVLALALLTACGGVADPAPAWQAELAGGGVLALYNCAVTESETTYWPGRKSKTESTTLPLLYVEGAPVFTISGADAPSYELYFAAPVKGGYRLYTRFHHTPQIWVDYVPEELADGTLQCRIDTVYSFVLAVGEQQWVLQCDRDVPRI